MDATPLLGTLTGVATFCSGAMGALASRDDLELLAFAVTWRTRQDLASQLPAGVRRLDRPLPARPLHLAWAVADIPPIEWLAGPMDVVHGSNFVVPPARRAARVVTVHDLTAVRFPEICEPVSRRFPTLVRRAASRGAWVHTPSDWVAEEVVELLGVDPDRVRAVHHGVAVPARQGGTGGSGLTLPPGTSRYILALGTVEPRKDLPGLVRGFDELASGHPDVALVLAGPDGWGAAGLAAALDRSPHRGRVLRLGWVGGEQRDSLLAGAAVFAYPSVYEGFGFPPLEAMAAGVPVVATRAGALPEVLGNGADLVPVGDSSALASALSRILDDDARVRDLVQRGRATVARYRWEDCAAGLARLYAEAVSSRKG
jgi:glycosyltransferase involved in cell wall biosynthesis